MADTPPTGTRARTKLPVDRERVLRTLTFWLRPAFVLRVLNRFQMVAGFDRAIALASSALTALIPLAILAGTVLPRVSSTSAAQWLIARYGLTGGGADAVRETFTPSTATNTDVGIIGLLLMMIAVLSFARGMQRLFERTWELRPLSVRNTPNDLLWIGGLTLYLLISGVIHREVGNDRVQIAANVLVIPLSAAFLAWSARVLSARRIAWRGVFPFALIGAVALAVYFAGAAVYVPHLFSSYATRYGPIGAVLAMISALFGLTVVLVGSAAVGREVFDELSRIRAGERPPDDDVKREWEVFVGEARSRWELVRQRIDHFRHRDRGESPPE
jgi:membrane protein